MREDIINTKFSEFLKSQQQTKQKFENQKTSFKEKEKKEDNNLKENGKQDDSTQYDNTQNENATEKSDDIDILLKQYKEGKINEEQVKNELKNKNNSINLSSSNKNNNNDTTNNNNSFSNNENKLNETKNAKSTLANVKFENNIAIFPENSKPSQSFQNLNEQNVSENSVSFVISKQPNNSIALFKYNRNNDINLKEFTKELLNHYKKSDENSQLFENNKTNIEGNQYFSVIKNLPEKLVEKTENDLIQLLKKN